MQGSETTMPGAAAPASDSSPPAEATSRAEAPTEWTTRRLLDWMTGHFEAQAIHAPRLVAELVLAHVLGVDEIELYMAADRPASQAERTQLRALVRRAAGHEPVQYLLGTWWFFGKKYEVDPCTLIPRSATETLVQRAIEWCRDEAVDAPRIADVGTGTGCIAVALALQFPASRVLATDVVEAALELAARNAHRHEVSDRVTFVEGDGLSPVHDVLDAATRAVATTDPAADASCSPGSEEHDDVESGESADFGSGQLDMLLSNPPYVTDAEFEGLDANVREFEPATALRGGPDGLAVVAPLIRSAPDVLRPGGLLLVEIGSIQRDAVLELAEQVPGLEEVRVLRDEHGDPRVLEARRAATTDT